MAQFKDGSHTFNIQKGDFTTNINPANNLPSTNPVVVLHNARAVDATHKSKLAAYAPKCKPGTRKEIVDDITRWVRTAPTPIMWFSGPAGAGKTCIMREVVARCEGAGLATASYFFSTRAAGLHDERPFVPTIAHQLGGAIPGFRRAVLREISKNPSIFDESLDSQAETVIIRPLQHTRPNVFQKLFRLVAAAIAGNKLAGTHKIIIAVDGLDECHSKEERQHLLQLFRLLVENSKQSILIIVASRPERDIRTAFDIKVLEDLTRFIRLQDYDGMEDTRTIYCDEFERIRTSHTMRKSIPLDWPGEPTVNLLISYSSNNLIVPATLMNYVDNPHRNPVDMLQKVLDLLQSTSPTDENPLAVLDELYILILNPPNTDIDLMKQLLHTILGLSAVTSTKSHNSRLTPSFLDNFFGHVPGTVETTLCELHSVLSLPSRHSKYEDEPIRFHHRTLEDFLLSPTRSNTLWQSAYDTQVDITLVCIDHLQAWARNPRIVTAEDPAYYASQRLDDHLRLCLYWRGQQHPTPPLPDVILNFDPRIVWRCFFVGPGRIFSLRDLYKAFHSTLCAERLCLPFCQLLQRMDRCSDRAHQVVDSMRQRDKQARLEALHDFDVETGLYDPPQV